MFMQVVWIYQTSSLELMRAKVPIEEVPGNKQHKYTRQVDGSGRSSGGTLHLTARKSYEDPLLRVCIVYIAGARH